MPHSHSIATQMHYGIDKRFHENIDRHSLKVEAIKNHQHFWQGTMSHVASYNTKDRLHDSAREISGWLKEHHPDVKRISEITPSHINSFLQAKIDEGWRHSSVIELASSIRKIEVIVGKAFGIKDLGWRENMVVPRPNTAEEKQALRTVSTTKQEFDSIIAHGLKAHPKSEGIKAAHLGGLLGLRAFEAAKLKVKDFDLKNGTVHVVGKGKRERTNDVNAAFPGTDKVVEKYIAGKGTNDYLFPGKTRGHVKSTTVSGSFQQSAKEMGYTKFAEHKTSVHANRKMAAEALGRKLLGKGYTRDAIKRMLVEFLGHSRLDRALIEKYAEKICSELFGD